MAFLAFTNGTVKTEVTGDASTPLIQAQFALARADAKQIAEALGSLVSREGSELRTDFTQGWTLFWKIRAGESRFFVAHPETDQWVGTLAVSETHLATIRKRLEAGTPGSLSEGERVSRMSNLEVRVEFV